MNESGRQEAKSFTDALKAGSATNLSSGFLEELIPTDLNNKTVSTLLLTDALLIIVFVQPKELFQ